MKKKANSKEVEKKKSSGKENVEGKRKEERELS
jgi:hypothetical protein